MPKAGAYLPPMETRPTVMDDSEPDNFDLEAGFNIPGWKSLRVYRLWPLPEDGRSSQPSFCGRFPEGATEEDVALTCGGGKYKALFINEKGQICARKIIVIDGEPKRVAWQGKGQPNGWPDAAPMPQAAYPLSPVLQAPDLTGSRLERLELAIGELTQGPKASRMQEMRDMLALMREMNQGVAQASQPDPGVLHDWWKRGFESGLEGAAMASGDSAGGWEQALAQGLPRILDYLDQRRAQAPARPVAVQGRAAPVAAGAVRRAPPAARGPQARPEEPTAKAEVQRGEAIPAWALEVLREFRFCSEQNEDPQYMAAYLERHVPGEILNRLRSVPASIAIDETMGLVAQVPVLQARIRRDYVQDVIFALQAAAPAEIQTAQPVAVPQAPIGARLAEDEDEDEDDLDDDDDDLEDEDDDDLDEEDEDEDDDDDDLDDKAAGAAPEAQVMEG